MIPIAFDTATQTGYAYRAAGEWVTGVFNPMDTAKLIGILDGAVACGVDAAVLEDCYCGRNIATHKKLARMRARLERACEDAGLPWYTVMATTWQASFDIGGRTVSADRKRGAKRIAQMLGAACKKQDECDAVCLCEFVARGGKLTKGDK